MNNILLRNAHSKYWEMVEKYINMQCGIDDVLPYGARIGKEQSEIFKDIFAAEKEKKEKIKSVAVTIDQ